jgi:Sec-independent protein translocase protein TatA
MFEGIFSPEKILLIAAVALIFLGPKRLPQIGRSVGRWLGDLRRATGGIADELKEGLAEPPAPAAPPAPVVPAVPVVPPPVVPPAAPGPPPVDAPPPPQ